MGYHPSYLIHFGIKGQKWGIRRYQNEDGSWTAEGRKRYGSDLRDLKKTYKESKKEYEKLYKAYGERSKKTREAYAKYMFNKRQHEDFKNTFKLKTTKKDKRQLKYEEEYIKKGMRKEDAEMQAYKRRKTEKLLAVTAGVTVAAIAGVAAYKIYKNNADRIIKKGTKFHRMIAEGDYQGVEDVFVSKNLYDRNKYFGTMARNKKLFSIGDPQIQDLTIAADRDIKIASRRNAKKTLKEMFEKNPELLKEFKDKYTDPSDWVTTKQRMVMRKARNDLSNGKITNSVYDAFNLNFIGSYKQDAPFKAFREELNKKGYGAMLDMNDYKYSGFGSLNPLILIDRSNSFQVKNIRNVSTKEVNINAAISDTLMSAKEIAKYAAPIAGANAAGKAITNNEKRIKDNQLVAKYQKEHPGTKMTYNEILRDIYKR